jgi:hypothetical protein
MSVPRRFTRAVAGALAVAAVAAPGADAMPALDPGDRPGAGAPVVIEPQRDAAVTRTIEEGFDVGSAAIGAGAAAAVLLLVGAGTSVALRRPRDASMVR